MYNLRYHIASLVAVFLSLSIGLLLGTIVVERGMLDRQKETIVSSLQEEFRSLDSANTELRELAGSQEDLIADLLPAVIEGTLADRRVLVITGTGRVDGLSAVTESIRSAGGVPVALTLLSPGFGLEDPEVSEAVAGTVEPVGPDESLLDGVVAGLVSEWTVAGAERPITAVLESAGAIRIDDEGEPGAPADAAVTVTPLGNGSGATALQLVAGFALAELPAVGAEAVSQSTGVAALAVEDGISGVDHIGTPEGTFSLVFLLSGRATGYYGYGDSATGPWPSR